ncbi:MFS transporter [Actinosynnema sp. NPDC023658]|uniref:MFS transporter n=1 Tax=Actinosynnema sp. NPDC023658 TaxID=3155465 RepID=UPI0033C55032
MLIDTRHRHRWPALATLLTAEAMNLLDATIVQVAAPRVHADLPGPESDVQWFSAAYTLPFAVLLITGGRLGDIFGRKRVFRWGVAGFVLASAACALATSADVLIVARVVQGAASALVVPQTIGLIRAMFDEDERPRALGAIGPVMGLAAVSGPVLGGLLSQVDWRLVFLVNVPLGIAVLLTSHWLPDDRHPTRLDVVGTLLVVVGGVLLVHPLIEWRASAWVELVAGLVVLVVFGWRQRRAAVPLVELSLFATPGFPPALVAVCLFFAATTGLLPVVVLHLQLDLHEGVLASGLALLPWSSGLALSSVAAGRLLQRRGPGLMFAGLAVLAVGVVGTMWHLLVGLALCGVGAGLFTTAFFTHALSMVRPHESGSAAGLINAVQQFGGTLGVAVMGTVYFGSGVRDASWVAVVLLAATGAAAFRQWRATREPTTAP